MTSISKIRASVATNAGPAPRDQNVASHAAKTATGRALIPLKPAERAGTAPTYQPRACFLAHLIATAQQAPQTRERRRAEPGHAIAVYAAAGEMLQAGKLLRTI